MTTKKLIDLTQHYENFTKANLVINAGTATAAVLNTRPEFNKDDYYSQRPSEVIPTDINQIMLMCETAYYQNSMLRSIIELISEFIVDGLEILHDDIDVQNFYQTWDKKVGLKGKASQMARHLYRSGNSVVRRYTTKISIPEKNKMMERLTISKEYLEYNEIPKQKKAEIPIKYTFYKPSKVYLIGDEMGAYSDMKMYGLRIPSKDVSRLRMARTTLEKQVYDALPEDVKKSAEKNLSSYIYYPLKNENIYVGHYNKDDDDIWAYPLTYSILPDLNLNSKLKLAKAAAFDGWCNMVRLWKLGDHKEGYLPPPGAANKLIQIIDANTGGGTKDIVWDSMVSMEEFYPPISEFNNITEDKQIVQILFGLPEELAGGSMDKSAGNNASVRIKNFIKKISSGRDEVVKWIMTEIGIIHRNMGFETLPFLRFKNDTMDDQVYFTLLKELVDRNILSDQTILERIGEVPFIERERVTKEDKERPFDKAGQFNNPDIHVQQKYELQKIDRNNLYNEVNKDLTDKKPNGRPPGKKDSLPRNRRNNMSRSYMLAYANQLYNYIDEDITDKYLKFVKCPNVRSLTGDQKNKLDECRNIIFCNIEPGTEINSKILDLPQNINYSVFTKQLKELLETSGMSKITNEDAKILKIQAYIDIWNNE